MRLSHSDKAVRPDGTKHPGQAAFDLLTANIGLTDQERHEVGLAVSRLAEAIETEKPWRVAMRAAGEPTREESAELAAAIAAAQPFVDAVVKARINAEVAAEEAQRLYAEGYWRETSDPDDQRHLARAQAEAHRAELALTHALEEAAHADKRVTSARAAILRGGQARQRQFVANGFR